MCYNFVHVLLYMYLPMRTQVVYMYQHFVLLHVLVPVQNRGTCGTDNGMIIEREQGFFIITECACAALTLATLQAVI